MLTYTFDPEMVSFSLVNVIWALDEYLMKPIIYIDFDGSGGLVWVSDNGRKMEDC